MAKTHALEVMDGAMTLIDPLLGKTGLLKLAVNIAGENKVTRWFCLTPFQQKGKPIMRCFCGIQTMAMSKEPPGQFGILKEPFRIGHLGERFATKRGVGFPKSIVASKIGQT